MQIKYSKHIETRLALRKIEYNLPKRYEDAEERFTDTESGHTIAVMRTVMRRTKRGQVHFLRQGDCDCEGERLKYLYVGGEQNENKSYFCKRRKVVGSMDG